jgi:hypothetical protein
LALELIGTGDQAGTWGNTTNTNLGTLIEQAISGYVTQAVSTGTDTTITIPNGATGVARNMFIELTGTGGASTNLIVPTNKKLYFVYNNASGAVTVKVAGQTGVSVGVGEKLILVSNGTDVVAATTYVTAIPTSLTVTTLNATSASITTLTGTTLGYSSANITTVTGTTISATNMGAQATTQFQAASANITTVTGTTAGFSSANITTVTGTTAGFTSANITTVTGTTGTFTTSSDANGNLRNIPSVGVAKTSAYTLTVSDLGEFVTVGSGGSITVPNDTFVSGNVISIYNDTTGNISINCPITTAYAAGVNTDRASLTLATRGVATVLFINPSLCVVTGNVS